MANIYFIQRLDKVRRIMREKSIDALLVEKQENYFYLTGMTGEESYCLITERETYLVVDFRFVTQAKAQAPDSIVVQYEDDAYKQIRELLDGERCLGFEGNYVPWGNILKFQDTFSDIRLVNATGIVEKVRQIKDEHEIQIIKEAVEISDRAFSQVLGMLRPGISENDISAELEYRMRKAGAKRSSFDIIVASGHRASLPHGTATEKIINNGDVVTLDFGAYYKGYCSDMTRTVFVGSPRPEIKKIYEIVLNAQIAASEACHAGKTGKEVDAVAREIIVREGYGEYFGHGLGHGVGVEIHEAPRLSPRFEHVLEDGMAVTIEPGIYLPDIGGVRIEDLLIVNGEKPKVLTKSNKNLIVL